MVAALALVALALGPAAPAQGAPTRQQVFAALGVDEVPADYVVVVDESGSMREGGLYDDVRAALRPVFGALSPQDHLSLITFSGEPAVRYSGPVGKNARAIRQLPRQAEGENTDIGAVLDATLDELERPDAADVAAVVLLTDGEHNPPAGSAFPSDRGRAWRDLGRRGRDLARRRTIAAYGLALRPGSDTALLKRTFADAALVALPSDQLRSFLDRVKERTRIAKARQLVAGDRTRGVTVRWPPEMRRLDLTEGQEEVELTLRSTMAHVPVTLRDLRLRASGLPIKASGFPRSVTLQPGERKRLPVDLRFEKRGGFRVGKKEVTERGSLTLEAALGTPWATVMKDDLQAPFKPRLLGSQTPTTASGKVGWGLLGLAAVLLVVGLALWVAGYRFVDRRPKLRGSLTVSGPGIPARKTTLRGRVMKIGPGRDVDLPSNGQVVGVRVKQRGRRKGTVVELVIRYGSGTQTRVASGHAKTIGDVNFAFRGG